MIYFEKNVHFLKKQTCAEINALDDVSASFDAYKQIDSYDFR